MENAIISKYDAIVLSAASSTALNPTIAKANAAGIPVILVNDTIDENNLKAEGGFVETYVGIDQYKSAALAGEYAARTLPGGNILLLEGIAGVDAHDQRLKGFSDQVEGRPGFRIVATLVLCKKQLAKCFSLVYLRQDFTGSFCPGKRLPRLVPCFYVIFYSTD
jgi:ABC-type sugar transport system substrate-binding protein